MPDPSPVLTEIAQRLQRELETLFSTRLPVVDAPRGDAPCIVVSDATTGDPYSGYDVTGSVIVRGLVVAGAPVVIEFHFAGHEPSGQSHEWAVRVSGVPASSHERLRQVFDPRKIASPWNPPSKSTLEIDGVARAF